MRKFKLFRIVDETGVSGSGIVAEGTEYDTGDCVMYWLTTVGTTVISTNLRKIAFISGHRGKTRVIFPDQSLNSGDHCILTHGEFRGTIGTVEFNENSYVIGSDGNQELLAWFFPYEGEHHIVIDRNSAVAVYPIVLDYFDSTRDRWYC